MESIGTSVSNAGAYASGGRVGGSRRPAAVDVAHRVHGLLGATEQAQEHVK